MKNLKHISILLIVVFWGNFCFANGVFPSKYHKMMLEECDACGCGSGGGSLGMGGIIENNFIGVRYLFQKYQSKEGIFKNSPKIDEFFNTIQLWSRIPIVPKLDVQAFVPVHFHQRNYENKTTSIRGLGDVSLLMNYTVIDSRKGSFMEMKDTVKVSSSNHLLRIGAGMKLPTGSFDQAINNAVNPSFQLGTGSVDYIANLQYVYKINSFGVNNFVNYYYKTANKKDYKFGNQFNFNSTFFYVLKDKKMNVFVPSVAISGEFSAPNEQFGISEKRTKGYVLFSNIGLEFNTEKFTLGALGIVPLKQKLVRGDVKAQYRTSLYFNYNLGW